MMNMSKITMEYTCNRSGDSDWNSTMSGQLELRHCLCHGHIRSGSLARATNEIVSAVPMLGTRSMFIHDGACSITEQNVDRGLRTQRGHQ